MTGKAVQPTRNAVEQRKKKKEHDDDRPLEHPHADDAEEPRQSSFEAWTDHGQHGMAATRDGEVAGCSDTADTTAASFNVSLPSIKSTTTRGESSALAALARDSQYAQTAGGRCRAWSTKIRSTPAHTAAGAGAVAALVQPREGAEHETVGHDARLGAANHDSQTRDHDSQTREARKNSWYSNLPARARETVTAENPTVRQCRLTVKTSAGGERRVREDAGVWRRGRGREGKKEGKERRKEGKKEKKEGGREADRDNICGSTGN